MAFHEDIYVLCGPLRVADVHVASSRLCGSTQGCVVGAAFARVLGQITCSEWSLRNVRKTSQWNTTMPCGSASPKFWDVTCPTPRGTSLSCLSPMGALVCAVHVESPTRVLAQPRQNELEGVEPRIASSVHCRRASPSLRVHSFAPKVGHWLVCRSLARPRRAIPVLTRNFSRFSSCDASGSRFLQLTATAGVACQSTFVATTEQLARQWGVLGRRGFALESAAARVCRDAGARVSSNVRVHGPGSTRRSRQSATGDCCWRLATFWERSWRSTRQSPPS